MKISLPIDAVMPQVLEAAASARRLVLVAEPGAGKTTRVPPSLLAAQLLEPQHPTLLLLQPRRVAARAAAARIAQENGWTLGREVGYQVRFERQATPETRLLVVTEGILTRRLAADPFLEGIGAVVLDEFHERSLHTDLALALLREVRETVRPDLLMVVMSATLEAEPVADFLGGSPVIRAEGRSFPVTIEHAAAAASQARLDERVAEAVTRVVRGAKVGAGPGDLLVFLPGWDEIRRAARRLDALAREQDLLVLPLHGRLDSEDQDRAIRPADRRKVILATNVAETSLTIEGVGTVIDSGLVRLACHDPVRGLDRLVLRRVSRASATQRAGRAGRTGPGLCIRLWPARDDRGLEPFDPPEVRRTDLCATVLALRAWGKTDLSTFGWFESPPSESLNAAERLLTELGALHPTDGGITSLGRDLLALPVHPRLGRLLLDS
ncbi:MAG TPA: helicase-related protein, partial [Isosphaeraceae bacterium]|nr:helicase-related protein [Isosphaeraceae bacterium]